LPAHDNFSLALGNIFDLVAPLARRFHGSLHGFSAGIHGQHHVHASQVVKILAEQRKLRISKRSREVSVTLRKTARFA